ncbi:MAG TPA: CBASS oligonucleotide cyclase [Ktedonobacteraceae bacterium]|nr:CBASS oligonucleotide cyclase [Ktedonobacteraceae bacterium]
MSKIIHEDIVWFAEDRVNLPSETAKKHRRQVNLLRERLEAKVAEDPAFDLVKMLHAGSVAKGTALRTVNDLDVAVYVKAGDAPMADGELIPWLADRLAEANPTMKPEQFEPKVHCVTINFRGTGLNVDVVPVLYEGAKDDCGCLVRKGTGERILTSIPLHLQFMRDRKQHYGGEYTELIRLTKWWKREKDLRFKSFMIELLWARLASTGTAMTDYPTALEHFFVYIVKSGLKERVFFTDHYTASSLPAERTGIIEVFDPVNPDNNIAINYEEADRQAIVSAAHDALDALGEARYAITKSEAVACWQDILGRGFRR